MVDNPFQKKEPSKPEPKPDRTPELLRDIKVLEERLMGLDKKIEVVENNLLADHKDTKEDVHDLHVSVTELKAEFGTVKRRIIEIAGDMKNFARSEQVDAVQKYIDLWNPIKFVTINEVEDIVDEMLQNRKSK